MKRNKKKKTGKKREKKFLSSRSDPPRQDFLFLLSLLNNLPLLRPADLISPLLWMCFLLALQMLCRSFPLYGGTLFLSFSFSLYCLVAARTLGWAETFSFPIFRNISREEPKLGYYIEVLTLLFQASACVVHETSLGPFTAWLTFRSLPQDVLCFLKFYLVGVALILSFYFGSFVSFFHSILKVLVDKVFPNSQQQFLSTFTQIFVVRVHPYIRSC